MGIHMEFTCKLYKKENNEIKKITQEDVKKIAKVIFKAGDNYFDGKGHTEFLSDDEDLNGNTFITRRICST